MTARLTAAVLLALIGVWLLASCDTAPLKTSDRTPAPISESAPSPAPIVHNERPISSPSKDASWERQHRERAEALMQEKQWSEAAIEWEILCLFRPARKDYAEQLKVARANGESAAKEYVQAGADAHDHAENEKAAMLYLKALRADPDNAAAAQALHQLAQDNPRNAALRQLPPTNSAAMARKASSDARSTSSLHGSERMELEPGIVLLNQGDYASSTQVLQEYVQKFPRSESGKRALRDAYAALGNQQIQEGHREEGLANLEKARKLQGDKASTGQIAGSIQATRKQLAEDYYQQGVRVQRSNLEEAIRLWKRALEYDPSHVQANIRLQQARKMQENLDAISAPGENH
jgi:tetratricopeptide (TPR) repeat protein